MPLNVDYQADAVGMSEHKPYTLLDVQPVEITQERCMCSECRAEKTSWVAALRMD